MTFSDWQQLEPARAAREVVQRVRNLLPRSQQRAAVAWLRSEAELAAEFAAAPRAAGPLAGVPFFAKDLFPVGGQPMLAGSTFLPDVRPAPAADGFAVAALRHGGAVLAGTSHLHEFAYGVTGENPHYGDCEHPRFAGRTTGGSSSGSAALVAAGAVPLALGTDTGGSVRVPAAFCGLHGFRLTPGDAWIRDAFPLAPTFDTAGWFTDNPADMLAACAALVGTPTTGTLRTGCFLPLPGLDPEVATAFQRAAAALAAPASGDVRAALEQGFAGALEAYHTTVAQEAWAAHATWADRYRDRYDPAVWQRLIRGRSISREQIAHAAAVRDTVRRTWADYFAHYDFLVLPASPTPALPKAECTLGNRNRIIALTAPASLGGVPVLTLPVPLGDGLTTGLQVVVPSAQSPALASILRPRSL